MGARIHSVSTYKVEYGSTIGGELTEKVMSIFRHSKSGWVSDGEYADGEISRQELLEIIEQTTDVELKNALILLEKESDKDNDFVRFALY